LGQNVLDQLSFAKKDT